MDGKELKEGKAGDLVPPQPQPQTQDPVPTPLGGEHPVPTPPGGGHQTPHPEPKGGRDAGEGGLPSSSKSTSLDAMDLGQDNPADSAAGTYPEPIWPEGRGNPHKDPVPPSDPHPNSGGEDQINDDQRDLDQDHECGSDQDHDT